MANTLPVATFPIAACSTVAVLPATGPNVEKSIASMVNFVASALISHIVDTINLRVLLQ